MIIVYNLIFCWELDWSEKHLEMLYLYFSFIFYLIKSSFMFHSELWLFFNFSFPDQEQDESALIDEIQKVYILFIFILSIRLSIKKYPVLGFEIIINKKYYFLKKKEETKLKWFILIGKLTLRNWFGLKVSRVNVFILMHLFHMAQLAGAVEYTNCLMLETFDYIIQQCPDLISIFI